MMVFDQSNAMQVKTSLPVSHPYLPQTSTFCIYGHCVSHKHPWLGSLPLLPKVYLKKTPSVGNRGQRKLPEHSESNQSCLSRQELQCSVRRADWFWKVRSLAGDQFLMPHPLRELLRTEQMVELPVQQRPGSKGCHKACLIHIPLIQFSGDNSVRVRARARAGVRPTRNESSVSRHPFWIYRTAHNPKGANSKPYKKGNYSDNNHSSHSLSDFSGNVSDSQDHSNVSGTASDDLPDDLPSVITVSFQTHLPLKWSVIMKTISASGPLSWVINCRLEAHLTLLALLPLWGRSCLKGLLWRCFCKVIDAINWLLQLYTFISIGTFTLSLKSVFFHFYLLAMPICSNHSGIFIKA